MKYTKLEMYDMLRAHHGWSEDTMDALIQVMGDTNETYKRILSKTTNFNSFDAMIDYHRIPPEDEEEYEEEV